MKVHYDNFSSREHKIIAWELGVETAVDACPGWWSHPLLLIFLFHMKKTNALYRLKP